MALLLLSVHIVHLQRAVRFNQCAGNISRLAEVKYPLSSLSSPLSLSCTRNNNFYIMDTYRAQCNCSLVMAASTDIGISDCIERVKIQSAILQCMLVMVMYNVHIHVHNTGVPACVWEQLPSPLSAGTWR